MEDLHDGEIRTALLEETVNGDGVHHQDLPWREVDDVQYVLVVPRYVVPDLLALVHCQYGQPGVLWTLTLLRGKFHSP